VAARDGSCITLDPRNPPPVPKPGSPPPNVCGGVRRSLVNVAREGAAPDRRNRIEAVGITMPKFAELLSDENSRSSSQTKWSMLS
jgi:hypothetical protein